MYSAHHIKYESYSAVLTVQTFQLQMKWKCGKCFDHGERFFFIIFYLNTLHIWARGSFTKKQQFYVCNNVSTCFLSVITYMWECPIKYLPMHSIFAVRFLVGVRIFIFHLNFTVSEGNKIFT
jgi:hypothetical protein